MRTKKTLLSALAGLAALVLQLGAASPAGAAEAKPAWLLSDTALPSNFAPGSVGTVLKGPEYLLVATNVGAAPSAGATTITATLPAGIAPVATNNSGCSIATQTVTCTQSKPLAAGARLQVPIAVSVSAIPGEVLDSQASISGGGATEATASVSTKIDSNPPPFGFLEGPTGFSAPISEADGTPATQAGSHPQQMTVNLGFPTEKQTVNGLGAAGHLHDAITDLPPGTIADPAATPVLCTEAELTSEGSPGCPDASQVGTVSVLTVVGSPESNTAPLYNMVPPPGTAAELGFDAIGVGLFVHIVGSVRSDGDFGLSGASLDSFGLTQHPIFGVKLQLWGDPSSPSHDEIRKKACQDSAELQTGPSSCPVAPQKTAFLTLPGRCTGKPDLTVARADSWEQPGLFTEASYESSDLEGNPVSVSGCNQLSFKPEISSQPTTNLTDSPSGLDFTLHQPQSTELGHLATAALKDADITLPAGMVVNPSQADGLGACSEDEIGYAPSEGKVRFDKSPDSCPDSSKLGTLEVKTPLLAETDESGTKVQLDPETANPIPRPVHGSVYLAKPFDNPFGSLIAIYLSINDPKSGTVAKLAGQVIPDPITGQLTTRFVENPQLPLEDVTLHLFGGARGPLVTPLSCGTHTTTSALTPWSTPEGLDAHPSDSFAIAGSPAGGSCPSSDSQAPNSPSFTAGTIAPQAGAYSPFLLKLSRQDGSQRLAKIEATLPRGLAAKFAGVAQCPDAQIAQAQARSHPNEGILERQSPSCPASSRVGTVDVAVGAGPVPFHTQGTAYLAGPYKGAPLSMVIITPAIAGPFDLGAVAVRTALYVDPETAQGRAVSDPLPTILDGIPLDIRQIAVKLDRPDFTLNPTSCDPMSVLGSATSTLGASASLTSPFQVGGCQQLPFKPKLSLKLKGGTKRASHPKLIATLKAKPGEANIASAQVKLPPSAFLDQAHIRTVCTRVQFAADACPKGSIYGTATAVTPLLSDPLTGNVYLRSSNHKLPDLVVALKGPASLPIEIDLDGKTDSVKGALRNTFEAVPDAPVSKFRLELFGGKRGLVVNSRELCAHAYRAEINLDGQNGKVFDTGPAVGTDCGGKGKKRRHEHAP
jgi:hypothetical protein